MKGDTPTCSTPRYVRDNIHVSLLAKGYAQFARNLGGPGFSRLNPSGYAETQEAFALRVARELEPRLNRPCPIHFKRQVDFPEPRVRINTQPLEADLSDWQESEAWDDLASYYQRQGQS